jgi:hypothetical protein
MAIDSVLRSLLASKGGGGLRGDRILVSKQDDDGDQLLNFLDSIAARQSKSPWSM